MLLGANLDPADPQLELRLKAEMASKSIADLDALYDGLPNSFGGTHYGTDIAKGMFHGAFSSREVNVATGALARDYVYGRYARDLDTSRHEDKQGVIFTGGGPGSGKTETIIQGLVDVQNALVFDSTLTKFSVVEGHISLALKARLAVLVAYVHRPVEDAMRFAIQRAESKGMFVDPARLGRDHWLAQQTLFALHERFQGEIQADQLEINIFLNVGTPRDIHQVEIGIDFFLDPANRANRYESELLTVQRAVAADSGRIAEAIARRSKG